MPVTKKGRTTPWLATIVLAVDTSLLYLIGDPEDPAVVWEQLTKQFQKKTWANKLCLRKKLYSMKLAPGGSNHIKAMTEIFRESAVVAVSQFFWSLENCVAATQFPRIFCR